MKTQNFEQVADPQEVPDYLEGIIDACGTAADELVSAWQDPDAGVPWTIVAQELAEAQARIAKRLKAHYR